MTRATCLIFALLASMPLAASRMEMPMGWYIRNAELIVVADTAPAGKYGQDRVLTVHEVIKGDRGLRGEKLTLAQLLFSTADVYLPPDGKRIAILLSPNWRTSERPVLEIYDKPEGIRALRALTPIYDLPAERARLLKLRELARDSAILRKQLFVDLREMREPANFPIITELFVDGDEAQQKAVVELIGFIGDARGVPTLIEALRSPHKWVAIDAQTQLRFHFPGGKHPVDVQTRPDFLQILKDPARAKGMVHFQTEWFEQMVGDHPRDGSRIREALLPILLKDARSASYLDARAAANGLRVLRHPDTAEALLEILGRSKGDDIEDESVRMAAFALADLGGDARRAAIDRLSKREDWADLRGPFEAASQPDELLHQLKALASDSRYDNALAANWIIYRLGDLGEKRAVAPLVAALSRDPWDDQTIIDAFRRIGGRETEAAMLPLLTAKDREIRLAAMEVLFYVQRERFLPNLRLMLTDRDFGDKTSALVYLAHLGEPADLVVLVPQSDFWTGDRENHYWLMSAIAEIRRRHPGEAQTPR